MVLSDQKNHPESNSHIRFYGQIVRVHSVRRKSVDAIVGVISLPLHW